MQLAGLDIGVCISELQSLVNGRVDKVCSEEDDVILAVRLLGKREGVRITTRGIWKLQNIPLAANCTGVCKALRTHLKGKKVVSIAQHLSERAVCLVIGKESLHVWCEFFGKGNVVLTNADGQILACSVQSEGKRPIAAGGIYVPPNAPNVYTTTKAEFIALLEGEGPISKRLATKLGLGGSYGQEVCVRAGVDMLAQTVSETELTKLYAALQSLLTSPPQPRSVADAKGIMITPFALRVHEGRTFVSYESLSDALEATRGTIADRAVEKAQNAFTDRLARLRQSIADQESSIKRFELESSSEQRKGELLYEHYVEFKALLEAGNATLKGKGQLPAKVKLDRATRSVTVSVE